MISKELQNELILKIEDKDSFIGLFSVDLSKIFFSSNSFQEDIESNAFDEIRLLPKEEFIILKKINQIVTISICTESFEHVVEINLVKKESKNLFFAEIKKEKLILSPEQKDLIVKEGLKAIASKLSLDSPELVKGLLN